MLCSLTGTLQYALLSPQITLCCRSLLRATSSRMLSAVHLYKPNCSPYKTNRTSLSAHREPHDTEHSGKSLQAQGERSESAAEDGTTARSAAVTLSAPSPRPGPTALPCEGSAETLPAAFRTALHCATVRPAASRRPHPATAPLPSVRPRPAEQRGGTWRQQQEAPQPRPSPLLEACGALRAATRRVALRMRQHRPPARACLLRPWLGGPRLWCGSGWEEGGCREGSC